MNRLLKHWAATAMFAVSSAAMAASGDGQSGGQAAELGRMSTLQYLQKGEARFPDPAPAWNYLWGEVLIDITVIGIVFALMTAYFIWRYRRVPGGPRVGSGPKLSPAAAIGWAVIPAFVFLADDFFLAANGWVLWNKFRDVPADRLEIHLESGMYSWDYTYPNGVQTQNELIVPAGKPILLRMTSRDTLHSHFIPDFRVKEDSMPGRTTFLWFLPREAGKEHIVTCAEYCGVMHSYMAGRVIVKTPEEFKQWYEAGGAAAKKSS